MNLKNDPKLHSALRFYSTLLIVILAILILLCCVMIPMETILTQYEAAQPKHLAEDVYQLLFAEPDWQVIYNLSGTKATQFEGGTDYVNYMTEKVGDQTLTYTEVPDGLSGKKRYSVRLEDEEVAAFTLRSYNDGVSTFPYWELDQVEIVINREETLTITILPEYSVYINGVLLSEDYTTTHVSTAAEEYLPEGLHGYRYTQQQISGLLVPPEVVVLDEFGIEVPLSRGTTPGSYTVDIPVSGSITDTEIALAVDAIEAEALFSIRVINAVQLRQVFDPNGTAYNALRAADPLVSKYIDYEFNTDTVTVEDFYRYSDSAFSVRVSGTLYVTDSAGNNTSCAISTTYLFIQNRNGNYMVSQRIDDDLQRVITNVRLQFSSGNEIIGSLMTDGSGVISTPDYRNQGGYAPVSWAIRNADGTLTPVLLRQDDGTYIWSEDVALEALTLYPKFK